MTQQLPQSKKDVLIYFDLITSLKTTQEVANFVGEIDILLPLIKSEKIAIEKALESISVDSARKIMQVFSKYKLDVKDRAVVTGFFEILKGLVKKFKVIKLVLAFDPTRKTIEKIHNFIKNTLGVGYILDIEVSGEILGGAIVIFNGRYSDFTVKKMIEDTFVNNQSVINQLID